MGYVDTNYYASFVVAKDANNRYYVLGAGDDYDLGVFQATAQITSSTTTLNNFSYPITVNHILLGANAVVEDNVITRVSPMDSCGWLYSSVANAISWANNAQGISALKFVADATLTGSSSININNSLTINQNHKTITNQLAVPAFIINGSDVTWEGGVGTITSTEGSGRLFLLDNSSLIMRNVSATACSAIVQIENNSYLSVDVCNFTTLATGAAIVVVKDSSYAEIGTVIFNGDASCKAVTLASGSTGTLDILASTVDSCLHGLPIVAYGRIERSNGHYIYNRDLNIAAKNANGDTVYLNMDYTANTPQTVADPAVLQLGTYSLSTLYVGHTTGTMEILGGKVNTIAGISGSAPIVLSIDSLGELAVANHPTTIVDGRYVSLTNATGDPISIEGGKFGARYDSYIANRHFFVDNTDADAALFPWKVGEGYRVTWKNWDFYGHDSIRVYDNENNKINTIVSTPAEFVGTDTTFIAWWADSLYTTPWDFENDVLTSDTTLYAEWHVVDTATEAYYTVFHIRMGLHNQDSIVDSIRRYAPIDSTITIYALSYPFYTPVENSVTFTVDSVSDSNIVSIHYVRDTFHLVWNLLGGHFADSSSLNEYLVWGDSIDYSRVPIRRGYAFAGWQDSVAVMPQHDHAVTALWQRNTYTVEWNIPSATVTYNAEPVAGIYATYTHEEGTDTAILRYTNIATGFTSEEAMYAAEYKITALSLSEDFFLDTATVTNYLTILKAGVTAAGFEVETEKFYDGNDTAVITTMATISGVLGNDEVLLDMDNVHAHFNDATVGENKSIIVYYAITGAEADNYALDTNAVLVSTDGAILTPITYDDDTAANGIAVNAMGYCAGNDTIRYFLKSGNPDEYNLIFSDKAVAQHFVNAGWTAIDATMPGIILIDIPVDAANGFYTAKLLFRNSTHPNMVSDTATIGFYVNLPKTYTMPLFSDVIALVDTCNCFTDIRWLHSADGGQTWDSVAADVYYYQEEGGLTGQYRVVAKMNGMPVASCAQDDVETLLADMQEEPATVNVYPNPAADFASISIDNTRAASHTLRVMSIMGVEMVNTTFNGNSYRLDLSGFAKGSYTVSVDGIVVRVIKK